MMSYAGIPLVDSSESVGVDAGGWILDNIKPQSLFPLAYRPWPGYITHGPILNNTPEELRPVVIDSLFWPIGASRFARGHFLVDGGTLARIRAIIYRNGSQIASTFKLDDGAGGIATSLWMLPCIPLSKFGADLWLLTLVDERYWWWGQSVSFAITAGVTTWANIYTAIGTALGVTITADSVSSAYGFPTVDYTTSSMPAPPILDAVAFSVGQRIVRSLSGAVKAQGYSSAAVAVTANQITGLQTYAGGAFDFNPV